MHMNEYVSIGYFLSTKYATIVFCAVKAKKQNKNQQRNLSGVITWFPSINYD